MKQITSLLITFLLALPCYAMPDVQKLDEFVRHQLMIPQADISYSITTQPSRKALSIPKGSRLSYPLGTYDPNTKTILFDGEDEYTLMHEIAHHYGANEEVAQWVVWSYGHLYETPELQRKTEGVLVGFIELIMSPFNVLVRLLPASMRWTDEENKRYSGSTEPWPQESWRSIK